MQEPTDVSRRDTFKVLTSDAPSAETHARSSPSLLELTNGVTRAGYYRLDLLNKKQHAGARPPVPCRPVTRRSRGPVDVAEMLCAANRQFSSIGGSWMGGSGGSFSGGEWGGGSWSGGG